MLFTGGKLVMAEAMVGLKRTHRCTEVSAANVGETVTVMGWAQTTGRKEGVSNLLRVSKCR